MSRLLKYLRVGVGVLVLGLALWGGCEDEEEFKITSFRASKLEAEAGETVTISWSYEQEDSLTSQQLKFLTLTFTGIAERAVTLGNGERSHQFRFEGPVDLILEAEGGSASDKAALSIGQVQDFYFHMGVSSSDPRYPYLGYPEITDGGGGCAGASTGYARSMTLKFEKFFAFYDDPENALVDDVTTILPRENFFRAQDGLFREQGNLIERQEDLRFAIRFFK